MSENYKYTGPEYTGEVTTSIEFIDPELARRYLGKNIGNRKISKKAVNKYKRIIKSGSWKLNGETIAFYKSGRLKDGQHRLTAIVEAGRGIWSVVVRGVDDEDVIGDRGVTRTVGNILEMAGYEGNVRNNSVIGALNILYQMKSGHKTMTENEVARAIDSKGNTIVAAYKASLKGSTAPICKKAAVIAAFICAIHTGIETEVVESFAECVNSGFYEGEKETSSVIARNYISSETAKSNAFKAKVEMAQITLQALKDFKNGTPRRRAYTTGKEQKEISMTIKDFFEEVEA